MTKKRFWLLPGIASELLHRSRLTRGARSIARMRLAVHIMRSTACRLRHHNPRPGRASGWCRVSLWVYNEAPALPTSPFPIPGLSPITRRAAHETPVPPCPASCYGARISTSQFVWYSARGEFACRRGSCRCPAPARVPVPGSTPWRNGSSRAHTRPCSTCTIIDHRSSIIAVVSAVEVPERPRR
jgi:hypothetical protein